MLWFNSFKNTFLLFVFLVVWLGCGNKPKNSTLSNKERPQEKVVTNNQSLIVTGADQTDLYLPLLKNKLVGVVANPTSIISKNNTLNEYTHLIDSLISLQVPIKKVFAPEHGFRGTADAGEYIKDGTDIKTGLPIISLYGSNKKPTPEQLQNIEIMVFDIQDVGVRFYTYISTLHYVMEACAENNIPLLILDRPNPNGHYIDGPVLEPQHSSFVGMHTVPIVHGMTIGEYAQMINGEGWLTHKKTCNLNIIPVKNYTHTTPYTLPIKPSPNLPNNTAINLYPSLCFFEGTNVNAGRGTSMQFQIYGSPFLDSSEFSYTPQPNMGAKHPKYNGVVCYGKDLRSYPLINEIKLSWLIDAYKQTHAKGKPFFNTFFNKLAGNEKLQQQIKNGLTEQEIKASWKKDIEAYLIIRNKYLLYK